ncbi:hypothetical protein LOZ61_005280 [Ophidiomyces ophidiicola]|nr:hypothetical protein LOZ61_005280 [Ophidiomyces ophidiicola]KAI1926806.1 hypothetical protein LOZ60_003403 [Ophidiomyces ophidiicola]KAI2020390.1 hypothetical protein LOZ45_005117 [Ophidiomyces ophidiicola]KAI2035550.1 hypothetical protein LOZ48_001281 [Ophidiomyces ophidiicola]KAI2064626.1 hypothetical protein LOZ40_004546 [Ophidiomyces ophidiicola]
MAMMTHICWVSLCLLSLSSWILTFVSPVGAYTALSDESLKRLPRPGTDFDIHKGALLAPILRPRVSGTPGSRAVLEHFASFFRTTLPKWTLELQNSTSKTPVSGNKEVPFVNLIAYRDPPNTQPGNVGRLTLVAHYDSKIEPKGFIGATDSAAPCAMIMHAIRSIDAALTKKYETINTDPHFDLNGEEYQGIQVIFLDGEEAFREWSETDSLYGSRSLAEHMELSLYPALSTFKNPLGAIKLFVLLDLLGAEHPTIPSYFKTTHWAYQHMGLLESRLRNLGRFKTSAQGKKQGGKKKPDHDKLWFQDSHKNDGTIFSPFGVEDDHLPFMRRGVDILHIIPAPFPGVWHRMDDDGEHLHMETVEDWSTLITAFAAEWLELEGFFEENLKTTNLDKKRKTEL